MELIPRIVVNVTASRTLCVDDVEIVHSTNNTTVRRVSIYCPTLPPPSHPTAPAFILTYRHHHIFLPISLLKIGVFWDPGVVGWVRHGFGRWAWYK